MKKSERARERQRGKGVQRDKKPTSQDKQLVVVGTWAEEHSWSKAESNQTGDWLRGGVGYTRRCRRASKVEVGGG